MSHNTRKTAFQEKFYADLIKPVKMSFFQNALSTSIDKSNFSHVVTTCDPQLWLEHNFISTFNIFLHQMKDFGKLLSRFHNDGSPNHLLQFRKFIPSGGSIQFPLLVSRYTELGFDLNKICPSFSKEQVYASDQDHKHRYSKGGNYTWFGNGKPNLVHIAKAAILTTKQFFSGVVFQPIPFNEIIDQVISKKTASGIPFFIKKNELDNEFMYTYIDKFIKNFSYSKIFDYGTVIAHRFQVRRVDEFDNFGFKARCTFVVSIVFLIIQAICFAPLILAFKSHSEYSKFYTNYTDPDELSRQVAKIRKKACGSTLSNVDFTKFDTSIRPYIKLSFFICMFPYASIQATLFPTFTSFVLVYWTSAMFSIYHPTYWDGTKKAVITSGSTLSGEYITSFFNTWVHVFAINYYSLRYDVKIEIDSDDPDVIVQGDDGLYRNDVINLKDFKSSCLELDLNVDDFSSRSFDWDSNQAHFLGRYFDKYCRPYQTRNWYIAHSVSVNQFNKDIPFSELMTVRHYGLALPNYNAKFAISLFAKVDRCVRDDLETFSRNYYHKVVVKDNADILYSLFFHQIYEEHRFQKWNTELF
jgi:hypothetical protein